MSVWSFVNQKGGAGKTTLLVHLAVAAMKRNTLTAVLDLDPQRSAEQWAELRAELRNTQDPPIVSSTHLDFKAKLKVAQEDHGLVLVDTPGTLDKTTVAAASVATSIIIPTRSNAFDRTSLRETLDFLEDMQVLHKSVIVLNAAQNEKVRNDVLDVAQTEFQVPVITREMKNQAALSTALERGMGVTEDKPRSESAKTINGIFDEIHNLEQKRLKAA